MSDSHVTLFSFTLLLFFFISRVNILNSHCEKAISQTPSHFLSLTTSFSALNSPVRLHLVCPSVAGKPKIILKKAGKKSNFPHTASQLNLSNPTSPRKMCATRTVTHCHWNIFPFCCVIGRSCGPREGGGRVSVNYGRQLDWLFLFIMVLSPIKKLNGYLQWNSVQM